MYEFWKGVHVTCAILSISGLLLRSYWMFSGSHLFEHHLRKVLPHLIDTLLLVSAIVMLIILKLNPLEHSWLVAKISALLLYIASGIALFRFAKTTKQKMVALGFSMLFVSYIVHTAINKNPWVL